MRSWRVLVPMNVCLGGCRHFDHRRRDGNRGWHRRWNGCRNRRFHCGWGGRFDLGFNRRRFGDWCWRFNRSRSGGGGGFG